METKHIEGTIKLVSGVKEHLNKKQIGFTLEGSPTWYNMENTEEVLNGLLKISVKKGNKVKFTLVDGLVDELQVTETSVPQKSVQGQETTSDIIDIKGKSFMTYEGLLKKAHTKGITSMQIMESFVSEDMKMAWCKVRVTGTDGTIFDGFGSSTPENTGAMTQTHPVEMAHTRAKGRALRDYLNIGQTMAEELKDQN